VAQASELSFPVVIHIENCTVHSGNPTVFSLYQPTPRWHHLSLQHPFLAIHSADEHRMIYSFSNTTSYSTFYTFFSDNIMADVASKQQTTALFLSTIVTRTRRHTELTKKKLTNLMRNLCCARQHSVQFFMQFFTQLNCTVYGALNIRISHSYRLV
jgi:hypothetical protein